MDRLSLACDVKLLLQPDGLLLDELSFPYRLQACVPLLPLYKTGRPQRNKLEKCQVELYLRLHHEFK